MFELLEGIWPVDATLTRKNLVYIYIYVQYGLLKNGPFPSPSISFSFYSLSFNPNLSFLFVMAILLFDGNIDRWLNMLMMGENGIKIEKRKRERGDKMQRS